MTGVKRSGKYVVDNSDIEGKLNVLLAIIIALVGIKKIAPSNKSDNCFPDPQPLKSSKHLSPTDFEDENLFEEDTFITTSSPTDV